MTKTIAIVVILLLSACDPIHWPHNETPHDYRLENNMWTDLGEMAATQPRSKAAIEEKFCDY